MELQQGEQIAGCPLKQGILKYKFYIVIVIIQKTERDAIDGKI